MPPKKRSASTAAGGSKAKKVKEEKEEQKQVKKEKEEEEEEEGEEGGEENGGPTGDIKNASRTLISGPEGKYESSWYSINKTLLVMDTPKIKHSTKIVGFDMDGTLLNPKSGAKFPKNRKDWAWINATVPTKLKELYNNGYKVVIFTNQAGLEKGKQKQIDITGKIVDLVEELGFPLQALVAAATDVNRKPNTTMWDYFQEKMNGGVKLDVQSCVFVGDAAGRPKGWKAGASKDFSCSDRTFAHNVGVPFKTPEEFFFNESSVSFEWGSIDPHAVLKKYATEIPPTDVVGKEQELIVFVGRPASGKSTFARKHFVPAGYVHVNQDTLKTKDKCVKVCREALEAGKSVVVDNTNAAASTRREYTSIAKELGLPFRCFHFETEEKLAFHLNFYREKIQNVRRVPDVGYNQFKSKFEEPSVKEGFVEVRKIKWAPEFTSEEHKKLFLQRT